MGTKVRLEMNSAGHRALLRSQGALDLVDRSAQAMADQAGEGFEASSRIGSNRARASVTAVTFAARKDEAENKTLTSAVGAGRF